MKVVVRKERPKCRKIINQLLNNGALLSDLICGEYRNEYNQVTRISDGLRTQARKMFHEQLKECSS